MLLIGSLNVTDANDMKYICFKVQAVGKTIVVIQQQC